MLASKFDVSKSFYNYCKDVSREDLLLRWDYDKNNKNPKEIFKATGKKYWFKCPRGLHESELKDLHHFGIGETKDIYCNKCNSFAQWLIDNYGENALELYWDYDKNDKLKLNPWKIAKRSLTKAYIYCQENNIHESYYMSFANFTSGYRCPQCVREREESLLQEKVRLYLNNLGYKINHEYKTIIKCINPKTKRQLPYDNEIFFENEECCIIEVHGRQHYEPTSGKWFDENFDLFKLRVKDRYKRLYAKKYGYNYLEIPYKADDKKETYKKLIDKKIKDILHKSK